MAKDMKLGQPSPGIRKVAMDIAFPLCRIRREPITEMPRLQEQYADVVIPLCD